MGDISLQARMHPHPLRDLLAQIARADLARACGAKSAGAGEAGLGIYRESH